jgi:hypothetical protein
MNELFLVFRIRIVRALLDLVPKQTETTCPISLIHEMTVSIVLLGTTKVDVPDGQR